VEGIHAIAFSPDGTKIVSGGTVAASAVWDIATGKEVFALRGHQGIVFSVAYSSDSRTIASGGGDTIIRLWDAATGRELGQLVGHESWVRCVAFSSDGKILASCGETIRLWDVATGKELRRCDGHRFEVNTVAFSPDGKLLASGSHDKTIRFWDVSSGKQLRELDGQQLFVLAVAFSPDGKHFASGGADGSILFWQATTGLQVRALVGHQSPVASVAFSPDGKLLASVSGDKTNLSNTYVDKTVRLWDVASGKEVRPRGGHEQTVSSAAFSADGRTVVTGSQDGTVRLWSAVTGVELCRYDNSALPAVPRRDGESGGDEHTRQPVQAVAFSPDGNTFAWAGRRICLCDTAARKEVRRLGKEGDQVSCVSFSPDGRILAAGNRLGWLRIYDGATGQEQRLLGGGYGGIVSLSFSPDGDTIVLAHQRGGGITVWNVATGNRLHHIRVADDSRLMVNSVAYSPDGKRLATGLAAFNTRSLVDNLYLWDAKTGQPLGRLEGQFGRIAAVAFSPDGRALASASGNNGFFGGSDQTIRLWEIATGQERCRFQGHEGGVASIAFSPDGLYLITAGEDTTALVWDVANSHAGHRLSEDPGSIWLDLAQADAIRAYGVMCSLLASPAQTVTFFKNRLRPASPADPKRVQELIAALDDNRFAIRQRAMQELGSLGELVEGTLRQKLREKLTLEMRQRVEHLLLKLEPSHSPDRLRELRAIEILEHIATLEAKHLLHTLSKGTPEARITQEAKASLERLAKRPAAGP
jgi:WD40 repeat protein